MTTRALLVIALVAASVAIGDAQQTGIRNKRPVFGAACKICPWGAVAEIVKDALKPYGYDVLICSTCAQADAPRIVAAGRMPPPANAATSAALQLSPNQRYPSPEGPIEFGATSVQNLWHAYQGTHAYAGEAPRKNLRLLATIQAPNYLIVAVKKELGVTDLSQLKARKWPLRGIDAAIPTVVRTGHAVYGRDDMPDDFAYTVAKALDEHQDLLQWSHLNFSYNVHTVWKAFDVPLHPGAARYYRERAYMK